MGGAACPGELTMRELPQSFGCRAIRAEVGYPWAGLTPAHRKLALSQISALLSGIRLLNEAMRATLP